MDDNVVSCSVAELKIGDRFSFRWSDGPGRPRTVVNIAPCPRWGEGSYKVETFDKVRGLLFGNPYEYPEASQVFLSGSMVVNVERAS
jgi:hypothetical protein